MLRKSEDFSQKYEKSFGKFLKYDEKLSGKV